MLNSVAIPSTRAGSNDEIEEWAEKGNLFDDQKYRPPHWDERVDSTLDSF